MLTRRQLLQAAALAAAAWGPARVWSAESPAWRMPDEAERHLATWMAFPTSEAIWGDELLPAVQKSVVGIANAIVQFEPVKLLVSPGAEALARRLCDGRVQLIKQAVDDLWMRDTGPVFVRAGDGQRMGVGFNFNGWGGKQQAGNDRKVAAAIAKLAGTGYQASSLTLEGGGIEVDGHGTAIITESCVLNPNRNPGVSKAACELELKRRLGLRKIIWLPGIAGHEITDGHTDFYARFAAPGVVVAADDPDPDSFDHAVTQRHLAILRSATDADGRKLRVVALQPPEETRPAYRSKDFAAGYINFYVCNGAVIMPEFGDADADEEARQQLQQLFPGRQMVQLNIDPIAAGGGGIHCATQQEPA